jgi:hypothetical protein
MSTKRKTDHSDDALPPRRPPGRPRKDANPWSPPSLEEMPVEEAQADGTPRRRGPGRPRKHRYDRLFDGVPDPPQSDPLEIATWCMRVNALAMIETARGRGCEARNSELRAFSNTIQRLIPAERAIEALKLLKEAAAPKKPGRARGSEVVEREPGAEGSARK